MPNVTYSQDIFKPGVLVSAIAVSMDKTKSYGVDLVKTRTPVDTGQLRDSWQANVTTRGLEWRNDAPYATYIEYGTSRIRAYGMLTRSLPQIEDRFISELSKELSRTLGAKGNDKVTNPVNVLLRNGNKPTGFG